jgi:hypothetical protein
MSHPTIRRGPAAEARTSSRTLGVRVGLVGPARRRVFLLYGELESVRRARVVGRPERSVRLGSPREPVVCVGKTSRPNRNARAGDGVAVAGSSMCGVQQPTVTTVCGVSTPTSWLARSLATQRTTVSRTLVEYLIEVLARPLDQIVCDWRYHDGTDQLAIHDIQ